MLLIEAEITSERSEMQSIRDDWWQFKRPQEAFFICYLKVLAFYSRFFFLYGFLIARKGFPRCQMPRSYQPTSWTSSPAKGWGGGEEEGGRGRFFDAWLASFLLSCSLCRATLAIVSFKRTYQRPGNINKKLKNKKKK